MCSRATLVSTRVIAIERFVNDFMTSPDFFAGHRDAITHFPPNSHRVKQAAQGFYDSLQMVILQIEDKVIAESWPYPFLRLELSQENVDRIRAEPFERRISITTEAILDSQVVDSDPELRRIFGTSGLPSQAKFRVLVDGWTEKFRQSEPAWLEALSEQVSAAVLGRFPTLRWELMRGMDDRDGTWYAPVINYVCTLGGVRHMQFDVYFDNLSSAKVAEMSRSVSRLGRYHPIPWEGILSCKSPVTSYEAGFPATRSGSLSRPSGLRHCGVKGGVVEVGQPPPDLGWLAFFQQQPEAFFHTPSGADLLSRIMLVEHPAKSGPLLGAEVVGAGEQSAVDPHRVVGGAAPAELIAGDTLPDLGDHLVASATRCQPSTAISASGRAARMPEA